MLSWLLVALVAGSFAYCLLAIVAALRYQRRPLPAQRAGEPVSILKPLAGAEEGLEENLRSFFEQDYPQYEILFAVRETGDPAASIVERLQRQYPHVASRLIVTGEPPYPNAKVFSLDHMMRQARHSLLVMSDSDIRVTPDFLHTVAAEFAASDLAVATCPYRAVPGPSLWSSLEAIMMNTEFLSGILVARMLEGMRFAVGPTIVARKEAIGKIGGWTEFKDFLAEDFVLGQRAAQAGLNVELSRCVIEHRIGAQPFAVNARHRLRWCRSTRRSRPAGYAGQLFTHATPLALLLGIAAPLWWPLAAATLAARAVAGWAVAGRMLHDPLCARRWWLVPLADIASFCFWLAGFFGNTITWRGRRYLLHPDGTFTRVAF